MAACLKPMAVCYVGVGGWLVDVCIVRAKIERCAVPGRQARPSIPLFPKWQWVQVSLFCLSPRRFEPLTVRLAILSVEETM